jgi:enoyl-CoA hydratase/carnithine racemase
MCGFVKIGLFPGFGAAWLYPRIMGLPKALEMLFTGDIMSSKEAKNLGILNALTKHKNLERETLSIAQKIAMGPPIAIRLMKQYVYKALGTDLETALDDAAICESITIASRDHIEGITSFRERRTPDFKGK